MNQMTNQSPATGTTATAVAVVGGRVLTQRAARRNELSEVHEQLMRTIDNMDGFNDQFRAFEKARMSKLLLANLHSLDPDYVRVCLDGDRIAGFLIVGPEHGNLWLYWATVFPEMRDPRMAMVYMRQFVEFWDNGRFHKISNFTTPTNRPTIALMKRFGFRHHGTLDNHVLGQGFMMFEKPLTKALPGYDSGSSPGLATRLMNRLRCLCGML